MITLKCKMCGGTIEVSNDQTIGTCEYCGSTMTLPRIESEKKARLFNRANDYRINCEFDKAYDAYRMIVDEDEQEAEAYWGMLLSEYGVEYVEDPKTKKRIPTCHRTQIKSIKSQTNYELACKYADTENKMMYQDEADELDRIQKSILAISSKADPYDVFICYKETDTATGERTQDSVLAQDIYAKLTDQGMKVFFSRITLADKLGKDYEPYIFSALTSAMVMLVIGTSNENVQSTWVKNEWSRYLHFMSEDKNKTLIPVYKDMQIYEYPDELNKFQGQDMNKVGAIQDLAFSVGKLVKAEDRQNEDAVIQSLIEEKKAKDAKVAAKKEAVARNKKRAIKIASYVTVVAILSVIIYFISINVFKISMYNKANKAYDSGDFENAKSCYLKVKGYKDSQVKLANIYLFDKYAAGTLNDKYYISEMKEIIDYGNIDYSLRNKLLEQYKRLLCDLLVVDGEEQYYIKLIDKNLINDEEKYNFATKLNDKNLQLSTKIYQDCLSYGDAKDKYETNGILIMNSKSDIEFYDKHKELLSDTDKLNIVEFSKVNNDYKLHILEDMLAKSSKACDLLKKITYESKTKWSLDDLLNMYSGVYWETQYPNIKDYDWSYKDVVTSIDYFYNSAVDTYNKKAYDSVYETFKKMAKVNYKESVSYLKKIEAVKRNAE